MKYLNGYFENANGPQNYLRSFWSHYGETPSPSQFFTPRFIWRNYQAILSKMEDRETGLRNTISPATFCKSSAWEFFIPRLQAQIIALQRSNMHRLPNNNDRISSKPVTTPHLEHKCSSYNEY